MRKLLALVVLSVALITASVAAYAVKGVVVSSKGKPIARAKVYVYVDDLKLPEKSRYKILYADAKGKFSYQPKRKDVAHYYFAEVKGYGYAMVHRGKANFNKDVQIKLWPEKIVQGRVVDSSGKPISGATVRIRVFSFWDSAADEAKQQKPWFWFGERVNFAGVTKSGRDGRFTLRRVPNAAPFKNIQMHVEAKAPGYSMANVYPEKSDLLKGLKLVSRQAATLSGTLYLPGKKGRAPAGIELVASSTSNQYDAFTSKTDKNRKFLFEDIPARPVNISLAMRAENYDANGKLLPATPVRPWTLSAVKNVELKPGQKRNLDIEMVTGSLIKGKVIDSASAKTATSGYLSLKHSGRISYPGTVKIDRNGEFAIRVPAGNVELELQSCRFGQDYGYGQGSSLKLVAVNGTDKKDVVIEATVAEGGNDYNVMGRPIPDDLELKQGSYHLEWSLEAGSRDEAYIAQLISKQPAKDIKLPKLVSQNPLHLSVPFDGVGEDGRLVAVFDESNGTGKGYDRAYIDCNRNFDLTDDDPISWTPREYMTSPWSVVQSHQGSGSDRTNNPVKVAWQLSNGRPIYMQRKGGWKGTIDSNKGALPAVVFDRNGNGLYNDLYKLNLDVSAWVPAGNDEGDGVFADTNKFGKVVTLPYSDNPHRLYAGAVSLIGEKAYVVRASETGNTITVEPYTGKHGTLLVMADKIAGHTAEVVTLSIGGEPGSYQRRDCGKGGMRLPVGKYRLGYCNLVLGLGNQSKTMALSGYADKIVDIEPDKQTVYMITGKPKLSIFPTKKDVVLTAKKSETMDWGIDIGDTLKSLYIGSQEVVPKVAFDKSEKMQTCKASGGG